MYGVVLFDVCNCVLCFVMLWNDICSIVECLEFICCVLDLYVVVGNLVMLGFIVLKLLWSVYYEFDVFSVIDCVLLFKDYLCLCLMGEWVFDLLDVGGILWLDVVWCMWFDELFVVMGLLCS